MTDTLNQGTEPEAGEGTENGNIRLLREKASKADELQAQLDQIQRERGIEKSGIDTGTKLGQFFLENFKGDVADIEAVKAAAKELGVPFIGAPASETPTGDPQPGAEGETGTPPENNGTAERRELANGAPPDLGESPDPRAGALESAQEALKRGATEEAAAGNWVNQMAAAAQAGDPRVIVADQR